MKIQCDVCEKAQATVICCADEEAALCKCDVKFMLQINWQVSTRASSSIASPTSFLLVIFAKIKQPSSSVLRIELSFARTVTKQFIPASNLAKNHQRFLATGIRGSLELKLQ
ncbi:hypothetical protein HAX54_016365 [Datura stramonium]|uniref:Uncharacterized protein n=1 Tax=Datura stramonium TaxID=4076 RepID=A0ABS8RZX5_DATST|nr:hypothetical protein [Datura stramonium]